LYKLVLVLTEQIAVLNNSGFETT